MRRFIHAISWLFFSAIMYLICVEAVSPWLHLPGLGNIGFTLVFVLFALTHCLAVEGLRRTAIFFAVSATVSYLMEDIGVRTGLIFGTYHYGAALGSKLGYVPILIPLAWFMMIYPSWIVANGILHGVDRSSLAGNTALALTAAAVMTGWDMVMDPGMAADGNWTWEHGGAYFGVPFHNYFGWMLTTFLVYWITGYIFRKVSAEAPTAKLFAALPIFVYTMFALRYVATNEIPALQMVAVFSMALPAFVALVQIFMKQPGSSLRT